MSHYESRHVTLLGVWLQAKTFLCSIPNAQSLPVGLRELIISLLKKEIESVPIALNKSVCWNICDCVVIENIYPLKGNFVASYYSRAAHSLFTAWVCFEKEREIAEFPTDTASTDGALWAVPALIGWLVSGWIPRRRGLVISSSYRMAEDTERCWGGGGGGGAARILCALTTEGVKGLDCRRCAGVCKHCWAHTDEPGTHNLRFKTLSKIRPLSSQV